MHFRICRSCENLCTEYFTYTKKIYVHEIAAINLSKIYFLKNAKRTCKIKQPRFKSRLNFSPLWSREPHLEGDKRNLKLVASYSFHDQKCCFIHLTKNAEITQSVRRVLNLLFFFLDFYSFISSEYFALCYERNA